MTNILTKNKKQKAEIQALKDNLAVSQCVAESLAGDLSNAQQEIELARACNISLKQKFDWHKGLADQALRELQAAGRNLASQQLGDRRAGRQR